MSQEDFHKGLEQVLGRIIQEFMQNMRQSGLSGPQIHALLHIFHAGECQVSEIGSLSDASPAAASQLVERLVQQGLVHRSEDAEDRRSKKLALSDKGLRLIHDAVASNRVLVDLMAALPPGQRSVVHKAFGYLARAGQHVHLSHN